jgi:FAD/FMN-containing dehydrogenase
MFAKVTSASTPAAAPSTPPTASNYRQVPIGVVLPRDNDDVLAAISTLPRIRSAPLLCRGGGTSLAGQCCNVAVVLDFSRYMSRILEIDPARRIARVQPGVVLDTLRNAAEKYHLTFAPDPASHDRCTIGGMIGNNSCGVHSVMAGKTDDNIEQLEVVTYDGTRLQVGQNSIREIEGTDHVVAGLLWGRTPSSVQAARKYRATAHSRANQIEAR